MTCFNTLLMVRSRDSKITIATSLKSLSISLKFVFQDVHNGAQCSENAQV